MGGNVSVKQNATKQNTYTVEGKTLQDIFNSLKKNAPKGGCGVALAKTPIDAPAIKSFDEEQADKPLKKGEETWKVVAKKHEITLSPEITMPSLKSDKDLSDAAKKEWARFLKELGSHEQEHVDLAKDLADEIAEEIADLEGVGSGKDKKAAIKAAEADFGKKYQGIVGGTKLSTRIQAVHNKLDGSGNTFILDTSIE